MNTSRRSFFKAAAAVAGIGIMPKFANASAESDGRYDRVALVNDIRGGVDVTFMPADDVEATDAQMTAAKTVIEDRLVGLGITDYESYVDNNKNRIIVRFPWKNDCSRCHRHP